jgi:hypothetical protein
MLWDGVGAGTCPRAVYKKIVGFKEEGICDEKQPLSASHEFFFACFDRGTALRLLRRENKARNIRVYGYTPGYAGAHSLGKRYD